MNCIPYVILNTTKGPLKFLIDTGANKNYISPDHVNSEKCRTTNPATIRNIQGTHIIDKYVEFNAFPESKFSVPLTFYVFKFHDFFDGLIGYEALQKMNTSIVTSKNLLQFPDFSVEMFRKFPDNQSISLNAHESKIIEFSVNESNGDFLLEDDLEISPSIFINSGLYTINDSKITVVVTNNSENLSTFTPESLSVEINNFEISNPPLMSKTLGPDLLKQIRLDHLEREERKALLKLIEKFQHSFYTETEKLSFTNAIKHKINTVDEVPIYTKSYRYPYCHKDEVQKQICKMLEEGIIRPSHSPWSSPIWVVPKKKDASGKQKWRLVVDYRKLNNKTIDDKYPIPNITEILDKLGRCQYFTTLDLASGFHQIEMDSKDIAKTAFTVENGHYEFVRMPFGLKNAPATFQRVMDNVLRDLSGKICLVYMDDIIVFSTSLQEHICNLKMVFETLQKYNLKIQLDKSEFLCKEVAFLGHVVTPDGVKPNPDKIKTIQNWPLPKNETELRGFLGTLGYYRRFIKDFARIIKPLTNRLRKNEKIQHDKEFVETFEKCKQLLTSSLILQYPDFSQPFVLTTDASNFALGAVLSQGIIGKDRPVAFASRTLTKTEENYSTIEKELLAIVWACKYFRPYLFGRKFTLYTDHKPLSYVFNLKDPSSKLVRWRLALEEFDYEPKYREGKQNVVADALSRIKHEINNSDAATQNSDSNLSTVHSADTDDSNFIPMTELSINSFSNQIILQTGPNEIQHCEEIFPKIYRVTIEKNSFDIPSLLDIFKENLNYKRANCIFCAESLIPMVQEVYRNYFSRNKNLKIRISQTFLKDLKTAEEQNEIIEKIHDRAHRGIEENHMVMSKTYYFPKMKQKLRKFIKLCETCNVAKYERHPYKVEFAETPIPKKPLDIFHIDIFISQPNLFISAVDKLSRFGMMIPIKSRSISDVRKGLLKLFSTFGNPKLIVCDNEPALKSVEIRGLLESLGTEMYFTPSNHSEVNGIVERFHSTISEIFRCIKDKHRDLQQKEIFKIALTHYNSTIHSATDLKPIEIFFGIKDDTDGRMNLEKILENRDKVFDEIVMKLEKKQKEHLKYQNKHREKEPKLEENEKIYVKRQGVKSKVKPPFDAVIVSEDRRKTFIDQKNRKLHKANIKRK